MTKIHLSADDGNLPSESGIPYGEVTQDNLDPVSRSDVELDAPSLR